MKKQKKTRARRKIAAGADLFSNEFPIPDADFFTAEDSIRLHPVSFQQAFYYNCRVSAFRNKR